MTEVSTVASTFDLTNLTPSDDEMSPRVGPGGPAADNPFITKGWLADSWAERTTDAQGKAKSLVVPTGEARKVAYLIRRAADKLLIDGRPMGARVEYVTGKGDVLKDADLDAYKGRTVKVRYAAKRRKAPRKRTTSGDQASE